MVSEYRIRGQDVDQLTGLGGEDPQKLHSVNNSRARPIRKESPFWSCIMASNTIDGPPFYIDQDWRTGQGRPTCFIRFFLSAGSPESNRAAETSFADLYAGYWSS